MRRFDFIVTCACFALLGYFAWHAWKCPRGYPYVEGLDRELASLGTKFDDLQQKRVRIEHRVGLLRPESIDPDVLDELARGRLDMSKPGDIVAFTGQ